jgi:acyloxyacyl hydrolase
MSNTGLVWICVLLSVFLPVINSSSIGSVNGGHDCAVCTIVLGVVEHLSMLYNESIVESLDRFCNYLPSDFKAFCKEAVDFAGKFLI